MNVHISEVRAVLRLAGPTTLTHLGALVIGTTDVIMMGWLSPSALAAGTLAQSLLQFFYYFGVGLLGAVAPLVAQSRGAKQPERIPVLLQQNMIIAFVFALVSLLILVQSKTIMTLLQQPQALVQLAGQYLTIALWGFVPAMLIVVQKSLLIAVERPAAAWIVTFFAAILNGISNYALMFGHFGFPALGLVGAAITSAIIYWFMFVTLFIYMHGHPQIRAFVRTRRRGSHPEPGFSPRHARRMSLKISLPMAFMNLGEVGAFLASSFLFGLFGAQVLAAHALALQISGISYCIALGLSKAASVRVGFAIGAGDTRHAFLIGNVAIAIAISYGLIATVFFILTAPAIAQQFFSLSGRDAAVAMEVAAVFLILVGVLQIFDAPNTTAAGALRGMSDTFWPAMYTLAGYWLLAPVVAITLGFGLALEGTGIWLGLVVAIAMVTTLTVRRWLILARPRGV